MLKPREKGGLQRCVQCGSDVPVRSVHCTHSRDPRSSRRAAPHHGRWKWNCPRCGNDLGCDRCAGLYASEVLCPECQIYVDGKPVLPMSAEERRLLIAMIAHSSPARAIPLSRLGLELGLHEHQLNDLIRCLRRQGVVIEQTGGGYFLRPQPETTPTYEPPPGGIELSLPLGDRK